mgnify:CR=1 FL=1
MIKYLIKIKINILYRSHMVWTKDKESFLLKEVAAEGVLTHKPRSKERGTLWQAIAIKLNALGDEVTSRSVRDHYNNMSKKYRARMAREERSTGKVEMSSQNRSSCWKI